MREIMLATHFLGLTMGLGTSFAHLFLSMATSKMQPDEIVKFRVHTLVLGRMGHVGLGLLIVSGLYLISPYWKTLLSSPLLIAKLVLVVLLMILIVLITQRGKKAMNGDAAEQLKKIEPLGKMTMIIGIIIVILAVYIFH